MTDERLDQILKQALAPEINDSEIQIRRKVRNNKMSMKKIIVRGLVACAVLTLVMTGGYFSELLQTGGDRTDSEFGHQHDQAYGSQYCPTWPEGDRLYQAKISGSGNEK